MNARSAQGEIEAAFGVLDACTRGFIFGRKSHTRMVAQREGLVIEGPPAEHQDPTIRAAAEERGERAVKFLNRRSER